MKIEFDSYFTIAGFLDDIKGKLTLIHSHEFQLGPDPPQLQNWLKLASVSVIDSQIVKYESTLAEINCPLVFFKIRLTLLWFSN